MKNFSYLICIVAIILSMSGKAMAVGFFVRPTLVNVEARRGETKEFLIEVINKTPNSSQTIEVVSVIVNQGPDGAINILESNIEHEDLSPRFIECSKWIVPKSSTILIDPLKKVLIPVEVTIPNTASGTYLGGLIIQNKPKEGGGIGISLRFLVRFEIKIQGTASRSKVLVGESSITTKKRAKSQQMAEFSNVQIINVGDNPMEIDGMVSLMKEENYKWRRMMTLAVDPVRVYPGAKFIIGTELPRRVPTGKYRLDYQLSGDGRRIKATNNIIDFVGSPSVSSLVADAEITISPGLQMIMAGPKSTRSIRAVVNNLSDNSVNVFLNLSEVSELKGVSIGDRLAEDLTKPNWFELKKRNIVLKPHSSRPIICKVSCPDTSLIHPVYYSKLLARAEYEDGQFAGKAESYLAVGIKGIDKNPDIRLTKISFSQIEDIGTRVILKSANIGGCHVLPTGTLSISNISKTKEYVTGELQGPNKWILPFGTPEFYGDIELNQVPPGQYLITCTLKFQGGESSIEELIQITETNNTKTIGLFEPLTSN